MKQNISYNIQQQYRACSRSMFLLVMSVLMVVCSGAVHAQGMVYSGEEVTLPDTDIYLEESEVMYSEDMTKNHSPIGIRYTKKHPLIIVGNWLFQPYSFINDHGDPDGFQVDLMKQIFSNLHVPYEIHLMDWKKAKQMVRDGRAHLMVCIDKNDITPHTGYSKSILVDYNVGVARSVNTPRLRSILLEDENDTLYIMKGDYVNTYFKQYFGKNIPFHLEYTTAEDALNDIVSGNIKYFVWGKSTLTSLIKRYDLEKKIVVEDIDIPAGRMRFFSNDSVLLRDLDVQFQRLKTQRAYEPIYQRWLTPEGKQDRQTDIAEIMLIVVVVILIVIVAVIVVLMKRGGDTKTLKKEFQAISRVVVSMTNCYVLLIDIRKMRVKSIYGDLLPKDGITMREFDEIVHPDDLAKEYESRKMVDAGEEAMPDITLRIKKHGAAEDDWRVMNVSALVRKDSKHRPHHVYLIMTDQTEHLAEQHKLNTALEEFAAITEIAELGMAYYDVAGHFVNCNKALIDIFDQGGLGRAEQYIKSISLSDFAHALNGVIVEGDVNEWFCAPIDIQQLNLKTAAEVRIRSVYGADGAVKGYAIAMDCIDNQIKLYRESRSIDKSLVDAKAVLNNYYAELRFILRRNNMTTFRWQLGKDYFEISQNLFSFEHKQTFQKSYDNMDMDEKDKADILEAMKHPEVYFSKPQARIFCFRQGAMKDSRKWMNVFSTPEYDEKGNFIGAFGVRCDITELMQTQEKLRQEAEKAQNSGRLKTLFLANMTHELRTPLNAINGFAEVMQFMDAAEDKSGYIEIMKHNCDMLINLIDNILQISMIDTDGIKIRKRYVDFAKEFPVTAAQMTKYITSEEVQFQMDTTLSTLPLTVDYERIMQILDSFVNNAAKFTKKGFIRVGYRYVGGYLTVYCRDTGCGIPKEKQKEVFERFVKLNDFVQGTGLGLALSNMLADSMGGNLDVYSREGEGSNFSFTLRCE